jgi:hypothetical protein
MPSLFSESSFLYYCSPSFINPFPHPHTL